MKYNRARIIECFLCLAFPLILYYPSLSFSAFSEDFTILGGVKASNLSKSNSLRYIGDVTLYIENLFFRDSYFVHHLFSLLLHGLTGFLSLVVARRVLGKYFDLEPSRSNNAGYAIAILFLLYPFHLESVFWIAGRGVILASIFGLLSTHFFFQTESKVNLHRFFSVFFYVLGLFCYESVIFLPLLFFLIDCKRPFLKHLRIFLPYLFSLFAYLLIGVLLHKFSSTTKYYRFDVELIRLFKNSIALHLRLFTVPLKNSSYFIVLGLVLISLHLFLLGISVRKNGKFNDHLRGVSLLFFTLFPFAWLGIDTHDFEGGRYLYFASIAYLTVLVGLLSKNFSASRLKLVFGFALLYFFVINRTVLNTWIHSSELIKKALNTIPKHGGPMLIFNVPDSQEGVYIFRKGLDDAILHFGDPSATDKSIMLLQTVGWDQFLQTETRFKAISDFEKAKLISDLKFSYREKHPTIPDSLISIYLFTSNGLVLLSERKE